MRLLVVGAGATGGYFGGRLAQAGRDVTFLVRPRRAAQLREGGLQIVSPHGDVTLTPKLAAVGTIDGPYDAVLLAVKAYSLDAAIEDFAAAIGPETSIVPVLNGMRHIDVLDARFGRHSVAGGVCKVATTVDPDGRIVQLAEFQELAYGERDGHGLGTDGRARRLHARRRVHGAADQRDRLRDVGEMGVVGYGRRDHLPYARQPRRGGRGARRLVVHPEPL